MALISGALTARAWYVVANLSAYRADLSQALALNLGTLAVPQGAIIGLAAGLVYLHWKGVALAPFADAVAPGLVLGQAVASLGALLSGDAYGAPTDLPWAIHLWGERRHPTQVYEALAALAILAVLWRWRRRKPYDGFVLLLYLLLYGGARLLLEAFRGDSVLVAGGLRLAQVVALALMMSALMIMYRERFNSGAGAGEVP